LRTTDFTYLHQSNSAYLTAHILNRVTQKKVFSGSSSSGTLMAQTNTSYDTTTITSTSNAVNHDYTNFSSSNTVRGNPTVVSRWLSTTGGSLTTTNYYDDLGNLRQTTDPGGHTYTLSYADNYTDGTNHNSYVFLTSVVSPTTSNGVSHVEGKQYYWYTGLTAAVCGQNHSNPAACAYTATPSAPDYASYLYDGLGRPLSVMHGDGGVTNFCFSDNQPPPAQPALPSVQNPQISCASTSLPIQVESISAIDNSGSNNLKNTAVVDALGRVKQTKLTSDPDGTDYVDTTFDALGRKSTVSNPYRSTGDSTYGITTYNYDELGRVTTLIPPDGTSTNNNVSTVYSGNSVTVTDQAGKRRRSVTDGLGHLIEVDEPGAAPSSTGVTASNGYVLVTGSDESGGSKPGVGNVVISGSEQSGYGPPPCQIWGCGSCQQYGNPPLIYDTGAVQVTVNGRSETASYGQYDTPTTIANSLAYLFSHDSSAVVTASVSTDQYGEGILTLMAKTNGASTDYSLSANSWTNDTTGTFTSPSFGGNPSGSSLTGGVTAYPDAGTVWVNLAGTQVSVSYGSSSTPSSIASALASAMNANSTISSIVTASASSGGAINFTEVSQGSTPSLSAGSSSNYPSVFSPPSFSAAPFAPNLEVSNAAAPMSLVTTAVTLYTYDALDNLTCVEQHGGVSGTGCSSSPSNDSSSPWRVRRFTYDSLSRLVTAKNPESGTISYTYDADGNLLTKTDARSITITYTYDQLHRLTQKSYSDTTPTVTIAYDGGAASGCSPTLSSSNPIGRRTAMCDAAGWEAWSYDTRGHVVDDRRNTSSITKDTTYVYNYAGAETSVTYPSGRTISFTYNSASQVTSASDIANSITYASNAHYAPPGGLAFLQEGSSGIYSTYIFNNRLQPCWMYSTTGTALPWNSTLCNSTATAGNILDYKYNFNWSVADNGNVASITNDINTARSETFTYDELSRVRTAQTQGTTGTYAWGLSFGYDAWANYLSASVTQGSATMLSVSAGGKNWLTGYSYDSSGNMLNDGVNSYTFNAESELLTAAGVTYTYDGDGNRVQKSNGKLYWLGDGSDPLDETDASGNLTDEYIFFGGKRIARRDSSNNVDFYFADHLGTARVLTNASGTMQDDSDFYPFGGERPYSFNSGNTYKFTGKERDPESGLDDFDARYYSSSLGRFVSADWSGTPEPVPYADFIDPQSLNLYTYVRNIPTTMVDLDGHGWADFFWRLVDSITVKISIGVGFGEKAKIFGKGAGSSYGAKLNAEVNTKKGVKLSGAVDYKTCVYSVCKGNTKSRNIFNLTPDGKFHQGGDTESESNLGRDGRSGSVTVSNNGDIEVLSYEDTTIIPVELGPEEPIPVPIPATEGASVSISIPQLIDAVLGLFGGSTQGGADKNAGPSYPGKGGPPPGATGKAPPRLNPGRPSLPKKKPA
jgi:RHS repeat-associated protein